MPTSSKNEQKKSATAKNKKINRQLDSDVEPEQPMAWYRRWAGVVRAKTSAFLEGRPHRSFRRSRRRDYARPLMLPRIIPFTREVFRTLWKNRKLFFPLMVIYVVLYGVLVGIGSQDTYTQVTDFFKESGGTLLSSGWGSLAQSSLTLATLGISGLNAQLSEVQQVFAVILGVMAWLTTVWLLRNIIAGHTIKMRDGLYNAGAPLISTLLVVLVLVIQLLPVALAAVGYSAATSSGLISGGGMPAMIFWAAAALLTLLSLYWITSSLFALIIVTLPGMYPYRALKAAGAIVLSRRIKLLLRWLWMFVCIIGIWVVIMLPIILLDMGLKALWSQLSAVPIVPVGLLLVSTYSIFWASTYIYLLYRKVVDNEAA
jgi:hypothetical protein